MAATILHSFAELAAVLGGDVVKAEKVSKLASFSNIDRTCGRKAACIWAFMQDQEASRRSGPKGSILHDMAQLVAVTGFDESQVMQATMNLVRGGHARLTANGEQLRAA